MVSLNEKSAGNMPHLNKAKMQSTKYNITTNRIEEPCNSCMVAIDVNMLFRILRNIMECNLLRSLM